MKISCSAHISITVPLCSSMYVCVCACVSTWKTAITRKTEKHGFIVPYNKINEFIYTLLQIYAFLLWNSRNKTTTTTLSIDARRNNYEKIGFRFQFESLEGS